MAPVPPNLPLVRGSLRALTPPFYSAGWSIQGTPVAGSKTNGASGFTLIELMVTLSVLAILAVLAAPSFADFIDKYRLRGAVDDAVSLISNARAEAVKNDRDVSIAFGGTTADWCVGANAAVEPTGGNEALGAAPCNCTTTNSCQVGGQTLALAQGTHDGVTVDSVATSFVFSSKLGVISPLGTASATFTSPSSRYGLRLNVNALGQAGVCVPSGKPEIQGVSPC
jgi:type IV fimbrial biogenesis protein FimT